MIFFIKKLFTGHLISKEEYAMLLFRSSEWQRQQDCIAWENLKKNAVKIGDRVRLKKGTGLGFDSVGRVVYVEPDYKTIWVRFDHTFHDRKVQSDELIKLPNSFDEVVV